MLVASTTVGMQLKAGGMPRSLHPGCCDQLGFFWLQRVPGVALKHFVVLSAINSTDFNLSGGCFPIFVRFFYQIYSIVYDVQQILIKFHCR